MKYTKIIIGAFLLAAAFPALAAETSLKLTDQNGTEKTNFGIDDEVYIEGYCKFATDATVSVLIGPDKNWQQNDALQDASSNIEIISVANSDTVNIPRTKIWGGRQLNPGFYDVIIDTNADYVFRQYAIQDCAIGETGTGFTVGSPMAPTPTPTPPPPASPPASQGTAPSPTPAPAPTPPASVEPSTAFSLDDNVEVKGLSNVRKTPGGAMLGSHEDGAAGVVVGGPVRAKVSGTYHWFWNINFDESPDGWVAETTIKIASKPAKPVEEEPAATPTPTPTEIKTTAQQSSNDNLAQASGSSTTDGFAGPMFIGIAIFLGLVIGSFIIAKALKRA